MSVLIDLGQQHAITDAAFAALERDAFARNDDMQFDAANEQRRLNDQAYFLYLFTRFESEVNKAVVALLAERKGTRFEWSNRRVWDAWARTEIKDIPFLSKVEVLMDKSVSPYDFVKDLYQRRNTIGHGGVWEGQLFIVPIAQRLDEVVSNFVRT